jgi:hypothetical protein
MLREQHPSPDQTAKERNVAYKTDIDAETARQFLDYNPETGEFNWRTRSMDMFSDVRVGRAWNGRFAGKPAGYIAKATGYCRIVINNKPCLAHRIAMTMAMGSPPDGEIDHINGNRADNRLANLRVVTVGENHQNICLPKTNTSGVMGVNIRKGKWRASIRAAGKSVHLGLYATKEEAAAARKGAEIALGFHPNHGRSEGGDG